MKKILILLVAVCALSCACSSIHIGPKGEGEYVTAESLVPYNENDLRQMKKDGELAAQKAAVEKVAGVFISSATTVEQAQLVEDKITSKTAGFIRKSHVQKAYRKGDDWYTKIKAMVLVKDIGDVIKESEKDAFAKKTSTSGEEDFWKTFVCIIHSRVILYLWKSCQKLILSSSMTSGLFFTWVYIAPMYSPIIPIKKS